MRTHMFCILFLLTSTSIASQPMNFELIGRWAQGPSYEIQFNENLAYLASGASIMTLDISNPEEIKVNSEMVFGSVILDFALVGNRLYAVDRDSVYIAQTLNSGQFIRKNVIAHEGGELIEVMGDYLIIADYYKTVSIFSLNDPLNPSFISSVKMDKNVNSMSISGNYCFIAHFNSTLSMIDLKDPPQPAHQRIEQGIEDILVTVYAINDTLYVGTADSLHVFNVNVDGELTRLGSTEIVYANDMVVTDGLVYVAAQGNGFFIYDVQDPANISLVSHVGTNLEFIAEHNDIVYGFVQQGGVILFDVSNPENPVEITQLIYGENSFDLELGNDKAFIAAGHHGIRTIDLSDISNLTSSYTSYGPDDYVKGVAWVSPYLYGADNNGNLIVYEHLSNGLLQEVQRVETEHISQVVVYNQYLFMAGDWRKGSITVVDISDPVNPIIITKIKTVKAIKYLGLVKGYLYAAEEQSNIKILDISNPEDPLIIDSIDYTYSRTFNMIEYDDYLFVASGELETFDISDPKKPVRFENNINEWNIKNIFIEEDNIYIVRTDRGMRVYSISLPTDSKYLGEYYVRHPVDIIVLNEEIYILDVFAGLYILKQNTSTTFTNSLPSRAPGIKIYPNPAAESIKVKLIRDNRQEYVKNIDFFDVSGRFIKNWKFKQNKNGEMDSYNLNLSELTDGLYIIYVETNFENYCEKIQHIK